MERKIDQRIFDMRIDVFKSMIPEHPSLVKIVMAGEYLVTTAGNIKDIIKKKADGMILNPFDKIYIIYDFTSKVEDFPEVEGLVEHTREIYDSFKNPFYPFLRA